jgi:hypothetical protein
MQTIDSLLDAFEARRISRREYDPERIAARLKGMGVGSTIDRNPANRTSGGDQLFFTGPDNCRVQLGANGFQG